MLVFAVCSAGSLILMINGRELNAFAVGEENARYVGVNVKRAKLLVMIVVSAMIGVCVAMSGNIAFVGLIIPHITRMLTGPNHKKLLIASVFSGSVFLMLCDLASRTFLRPRELPIGVVTSFIGAIVFIFIFFRSRRKV